MKNLITILAITVLSAGLNVSQAGELENLKVSSDDITKIDLSSIQKDSTKPGIDVDFNIDVSIPGIYPPYPNPHYPPQPNYQHEQIIFQSGEFRFASGAEESMDYAVTSLKNRGFIVLEANRNWDKYKIAFMADSSAQIQRYDSQTYTFSSDAEKALKQAVQAFEASGVVILEQNLQWDKFTIQYLKVPQPHPNYPPYLPSEPYRTDCAIRHENGETTARAYVITGRKSVRILGGNARFNIYNQRYEQITWGLKYVFLTTVPPFSVIDVNPYVIIGPAAYEAVYCTFDMSGASVVVTP
ncbi:MAG: hypothetical protein HY746_00115 [Elusimicrobia bacterium]|nr:hypothetical protein [Elusimicrobiota bacterium]